MGGDISFTGAEVVLITGIVGAMATPITILFWALIGSLNSRIKREQELLDALRPVVERVAVALETEISQSKFLREQLEKSLQRTAAGM